MTPTRVMAIQNHTEFQEVLGNTSFKLVVLMFTAGWSEPCKLMKPMFEDIASRFKNDAEFYMLDIDKFKDYAMHLINVEALPTFLLVKNNCVQERVVGIDKEELVRSIQRHKGKFVITIGSERDRGHFGGAGVAQESKGKITPTPVMAIQNTRELEEVLQKTRSKLLVLVFTVASSERCIYFKPKLKDVASHHKHDAEFYTLDFYQFMEFARSLGVEGVPTFVLVKNFIAVGRVTSINREEVQSFIQKHTGTSKVDSIIGGRDEKLESSIQQDTEANKVDDSVNRGNNKLEGSIEKPAGANKVDYSVNRGNNKLEGSIEKPAGAIKVEDRVIGANKEKLNGSSIVQKKHTDANKIEADRDIGAEKERLVGCIQTTQGHTGAGVAVESAARLTLTFFPQKQTVGLHRPEAGGAVGKPRPSKKQLSAIWAWTRGKS